MENNTYNLAKIEEDTIIKCVAENLDKTRFELAEMLGISERTLYRKANANKKLKVLFLMLDNHITDFSEFTDLVELFKNNIKNEN